MDELKYVCMYVWMTTWHDEGLEYNFNKVYELCNVSINHIII